MKLARPLALTLTACTDEAAEMETAETEPVTAPEPPGAAADDTTVEPAANQPTGGDGKDGSAATDGASVPTATDSGNRPGDDG